MPRMTPALAQHQRNVNRVLSIERRLEVAELTGRLRAEARRMRRERGVQAPSGLSRVEWSAGLMGVAVMLEKRRQLGLSIDYHLKTARQMLGEQ